MASFESHATTPTLGCFWEARWYSPSECHGDPRAPTVWDFVCQVNHCLLAPTLGCVWEARWGTPLRSAMATHGRPLFGILSARVNAPNQLWVASGKPAGIPLRNAMATLRFPLFGDYTAASGQMHFTVSSI